jgi:hypothetical protein
MVCGIAYYKRDGGKIFRTWSRLTERLVYVKHSRPVQKKQSEWGLESDLTERAAPQSALQKLHHHRMDPAFRRRRA